jgi:phospholipid/cholesterol/gamma-HCH transport system ATP-binding protein
MAHVSIENLSKAFGNQQVLDGVNINVARGESIVIIGQSGCGKSILLRHILRLMSPDRGRVLYDGEDIAMLNDKELFKIRQRMGLLFQSAALFDSLTVAENVGLGLKESRLYGREEISEIVMDKLALVGLASAADKHPSQLSGGMRKRVGLARAFATNPDLLLYDEPTTGLDPITADMINNLIVELNEKTHVTSIAVTHDMTSAYKIADRIVMLYRGKVEFDGSPQETRNSVNPVVQQFINGQAVGPVEML